MMNISHILMRARKNSERSFRSFAGTRTRFIRGFTGDGQVIGKRDDPEANMWLNHRAGLL